MLERSPGTPVKTRSDQLNTAISKLVCYHIFSTRLEKQLGIILS